MTVAHLNSSGVLWTENIWRVFRVKTGSGVVCMGHKDRLFHSILVFIRGRKDERLFILRLMTSRLFYEPFKVSRLSLFRAETASRRWVILVTDITWRNESSDVTLAIMRRSSIGITFFFSWNKIEKPLTIWKQMIISEVSTQSCLFKKCSSSRKIGSAFRVLESSCLPNFYTTHL